MKKQNGFPISLAFAIFFCVGLVFTIEDSYDKKVKEEQQILQQIGRFDVIKEFRALDTDPIGWKAEIWQDRENGACYLYMYRGPVNGGPIMILEDCPSDG